jgi:UDP-N-acetylglucosamine 2-epimerase (non-hydrolysing)
MASPRLSLVLGIRPDVIRASLIIQELTRTLGEEFEFIWSGQHYSDNLKDVFFRQLDVPRPSMELGARGESDPEIAGSVISLLGQRLAEARPDAVAFLGDTNTVSGTLAAAAMGIPVVHIEGCMRSYDWRMPEEKYRTVADHLSDIIYAYLPAYARQGIAEGIPEERIVVTGNPIVDVLDHYFVSGKIRMAPSVRDEWLKTWSLAHGEFLLMTCHRRENVESLESLTSILDLAASAPTRVLFPAGYRTQREMKRLGVTVPGNVIVIDPVGYQEFLELLDASRGVLTDSGTVVEEASILMKPSIQMRRSTERPEVYDVGGSVKFDPSSSLGRQAARSLIDSMLALKGSTWEHTLGDGNSSQRIVTDLLKRLGDGSFDTHAPDFSSPLVRRAYSLLA